MRAAVLEKVGQTPQVRQFDDPTGDHIVTVTLAGCNPVDLALASGAMGQPEVPRVVGKEGVGRAADDPFVAALKASAPGATLITVGQGAGCAPGVPFVDLMGRTHIGHMNDFLPADIIRKAYADPTGLAAEGRITVETTRYSLDDAAKAWQAQADSPHAKIGVAP